MSQAANDPARPLYGSRTQTGSTARDLPPPPPPLYLVGGAVGELLGLRGGSRVPLWW